MMNSLKLHITSLSFYIKRILRQLYNRFSYETEQFFLVSRNNFFVHNNYFLNSDSKTAVISTFANSLLIQICYMRLEYFINFDIRKKIYENCYNYSFFCINSHLIYNILQIISILIKHIRKYNNLYSLLIK